MEFLREHNIPFYKSESVFDNKHDNIHTMVMKNYKIGMHRQDFFEINIITSGEGKHFIENSSVCAEKGDVFIIPPDVRHGYLGGMGFDVFHILIDDRFLEKNMSDLQLLPSFFTLFTAEPLLRDKTENALHLKLSDVQFEEINQIILKVLDYKDTEVTFYSPIRIGFALAIISLLCKAYTENNENNVTTNSDGAFLNSISYIHEQYHNRITIDELAKIACLSRSSFVRKFKAVCKMTPLDYITKCRIEAAEFMLLNTNFPLLNIAFKIGFYDAAHFSRVFTRYTGISPSEYKRKYRAVN